MLFNPNGHDNRVIQWNAADKAGSLRTKYNLNQDSIIFDVGAYDGSWARKMFGTYHSIIHCFEPVLSIYNQTCDVFKNNPKVHVHNYGLGGETREEQITLLKDGSSIFVDGGQKETIKIVSMKDIMEQLSINHVQLLKINIEGGEYELLKHIIQENMQNNFDNYQIQFHPVTNSYDGDIDYIRNELLKTHKLTYCFDFIWENWEVK